MYCASVSLVYIQTTEMLWNIASKFLTVFLDSNYTLQLAHAHTQLTYVYVCLWRGVALYASCKDVWYKFMYFIISVQFILKKFLAKMGASAIFSFMKEEWKCVLTPGVPYFIQGVSRNALTNFNSRFFTSKPKVHIFT